LYHDHPAVRTGKVGKTTNAAFVRTDYGKQCLRIAAFDLIMEVKAILQL
jgi:hypothetical protein